MDEGLSYPAFARGRGGAAPCPNGYLLNFSKELNPSSILYILFFMADATNRLSKSQKNSKKMAGHVNMCVWDFSSPCMGARCPRRTQCEAAKQAARANNGGGNNRRHNNNSGNNRRHNNGNDGGNSNRRMPQTPPPYHGPQGGNNITVNNIIVNNNYYGQPIQQSSTSEDNTILGWLKGKLAGAIGGRTAAEAMFKGQLPS